MTIPRILCFLLSCQLAVSASAETCPSPQEIRARLVSVEYEWSVAEDVSLEGLLAVKKLYGVSIENHGEFVACKYEAPGQYVRLDGILRQNGCPVIPLSKNWAINTIGQLACEDEDLVRCVFDNGC